MEIEKAFLANLIVGGLKEAKKVRDIVKTEDFVLSEHQRIFGRIMGFTEKGKEFDAAILASSLRGEEAGRKMPVNFSKYIATLVAEWYISPSMQNQYVAKFYERRLLRKISEVIAEFNENPESIDPAEFFDKIDKIKKEVRIVGGFVKLSDVMKKVLDSIEKQKGVDFRFSLIDLDRELGGLARGELLLIGGFTSQGKSSLCIQMAIDFAEQGKRILFCSSEMSSFEIARRVLGNYCNLVVRDLRLVKIEKEKIPSLREVVDTLSAWEIALCVVSGVSQVKRAVLEYRPDIVFVDHLHNLKGEGRSLYERTTNNIKSLQETALSERVGMIVACQLHRPQDDKVRPPRISDLRESGALEETANSVILLYWKNQRENKELSDIEEMEVRLVKNRDGKTGRFRILFEPRYCRFKNAYNGGGRD